MSALGLFKSLQRDERVVARPRDVSGLWWQQPQNPLTPIVIDDIYGDLDIVDRSNALRVPAVSRGRSLIVGAIADLPLIAYRGDQRIETQPTWAYRSDRVSPWHRIAFTIDDLIFYDCSLWRRINGADGFPIDAWRVPPEWWTVDDQGRILVDEDGTGNPAPVSAADVIYIPGPGTGLLHGAADTIKGARQIEKSWIARTRSPIPPTLFRQIEKENVDEEDVKNLTASWGAARSNPETAAVGFVPYGIEPVFPDMHDDSQLFIEGRNAVRLDIANHLNLPASLLDGSTATASLTYVTTEGQKSSFYEQTLRYWTAPLEHRLSMDDVVPKGQRVRFDITYLTQVAPTGEPGED